MAFKVTSTTARSTRIEKEPRQVQLNEIKRLAKTENNETAQVLEKMSSAKYKASLYLTTVDVAR